MKKVVEKTFRKYQVTAYYNCSLQQNDLTQIL